MSSTPPAPLRNPLARTAALITRGILILGLLAGTLHVMGWEPQLPSDSCSLRETEQGDLSAWLYDTLAGWGLHHVASPYVAVVHIDPTSGPADLLTNNCSSRAFLTQLIPSLNRQRVSVIAIDKYYTSTCSTPHVDDDFIQAVTSSAAPVVIGLETDQAEKSRTSGGCLTLSHRFPFTQTTPGQKPARRNIFFGLTRLNAQILQIPLAWQAADNPDSAQAIPSGDANAPDHTQQDCADCRPGLALVAARALDANVDSIDNNAIQSLLSQQVHPYATVLDLPTVDAFKALCAAPAPGDAKPAYNCSSDHLPASTGALAIASSGDGSRHYGLAGKVVVVGDYAPEVDIHDTAHGVDLQASYIESILEQRFLKQIPGWIVYPYLGLFAVGIYFIYWKWDHRLQLVFAISLAALALTIAFSLAVLLGFGYYTPVWALLGMCLFVLSRYFEVGGHHHLLSFFDSHFQRDLSNTTHHSE
jgi:CHASE2 domain-containing sensor protein